MSENSVSLQKLSILAVCEGLQTYRWCLRAVWLEERQLQLKLPWQPQAVPESEPCFLSVTDIWNKDNAQLSRIWCVSFFSSSWARGQVTAGNLMALGSGVVGFFWIFGVFQGKKTKMHWTNSACNIQWPAGIHTFGVTSRFPFQNGYSTNNLQFKYLRMDGGEMRRWGSGGGGRCADPSLEYQDQNEKPHHDSCEQQQSRYHCEYGANTGFTENRTEKMLACILGPNPHRTRDAMRCATRRKEMGPVDVNGGVHTVRKQHQRKNVRICARRIPRPV